LLHEWSHNRNDLVHEPDRVHHIDPFKSQRYAFLNILQGFTKVVYRQSGQVTKSRINHVHKKYISLRTTIRIKVRVIGHEQQLEAIVEYVLGWPWVRQSLNDYPVTILIKLRKYREFPTTQIKVKLFEHILMY